MASGRREQAHARTVAQTKGRGLELVASGAKWGRGPKGDIHSSQKANVDSPVWRLVHALDSLVTPDGNTPTIEGWFENVRPLSQREKELIAELARNMISLSGMTVREDDNQAGDVEIAYVGLRPGEKLYEELFVGEGALEPLRISYPSLINTESQLLNVENRSNGHIT